MSTLIPVIAAPAALVLVYLLVQAVKRYFIPQMNRWSSTAQQIVVGAVAALLAAAATALRVAVPEGGDIFSVEVLALIVEHAIYWAAGAMGVHGMVSPRKAKSGSHA